MNDIYRVLRPRGRFFFTYLDMETHETVYNSTVEQTASNTLPHLNQFLHKDQILFMAKKSGFIAARFEPDAGIEQSIALLTK